MVEEDFTILDQVPSVVHINVGGQLFLTSRETLLKVWLSSDTLRTLDIPEPFGVASLLLRAV
jgi:hypothetical protein